MREPGLGFILKGEISHIREVSPKVVALGIKHFADTTLVTDAPWTVRVDDKIRGFFVEAAPLTPDTLSPNFWEHSLLTSIYARRIAARIGRTEVSPLKAQANGFLHDLGRLVLPHRYFVNDVVGNILSGEIGLRNSFRMDQYPFDRILGFYHPLPVEDLKDLSLPQQINHLADALGRKTEDDHLFDVSDILNLSPAGKYPGGVWNTEDRALTIALVKGREEFENQLRAAEVSYFQSEFGIDFEDLREKVWEEFQDPRNQQWLQTVQEAQQAHRFK